MRRLRLLIKRFDFVESIRRELAIGQGIRLHPREHCLTLAWAPGGYSTSPDLQIRTRLTNPASAKRWVGFEATLKRPSGTSVGYRLSSDGVDNLWWNGNTWIEALPGQWSSEEDVADHIAEYAGHAIQVILNLKTTDSQETPQVFAVKLLYESDLDFGEEYIARSLVPELRETLRPIADYQVKLQAPTDSFDLKKLETPYNLVGLDSIYNVTDDPNRYIDLGLDYSSVTKVVRATETIAANKTVLVRFVYQPEVSITTSQEWIELGKVPAVVIDSIQESGFRMVSTGDSVINKRTGQGYQLRGITQKDIGFNVRWVADKQKDADRLKQAIRNFFNSRMLRARGQDESVHMHVVEEFEGSRGDAQSELHPGRLRVRISGALFFSEDAAPVSATKRLLVTGGNLAFQKQ
jgi:hypothetical protein